MAFTDLLSQVGVDNVEIGGLSMGMISNIILLVIFACIAGGVAYWAIIIRSYNKTIVKFREINGLTRQVGSEKAKEIILPNTSVRAFYLKKSRVHLPRPSIETGMNTYWMFIREDGEWINVGLTNVNEELKLLGLKFDHTDMRMANAALKKLIDRSYKKQSFMEKWAPYLGFGTIILIVGIGAFLIVGETQKVVGAAAANVDSLRQITETMSTILQSMSNIASSGSGVKPA